MSDFIPPPKLLVVCPRWSLGAELHPSHGGKAKFTNSAAWQRERETEGSEHLQYEIVSSTVAHEDGVFFV